MIFEVAEGLDDEDETLPEILLFFELFHATHEDEFVLFDNFKGVFFPIFMGYFLEMGFLLHLFCWIFHWVVVF